VGGPDDYDLPPPTTSGAVIPTNGVLEQGNLTNGVHPVEEDQWRKVGHAPRFGTGETDSIKGEALLLDHQTWLEGQLEEKFFGGIHIIRSLDSIHVD
jgi:hypothetical protein